MGISRRQLGALACATVFSLGAGQPVLAADTLNVVATTGMIADAARVIGGDQVEVKSLMGSGVDPHGYRQTRTDIVAMTRADLVLWNGLYLEAQMEDFLHDLAGRVPVVAVGEAIDPEKLRAHDTYEGRYDPHVWMNPRLWQGAVIAVRDALSETQPEDAELFAANAETYLADTTRLADYADTVLASVSDEHRVLVTAHDAFNYFGAAHDFEVMGIQGLSTSSEAGLNRIAELVDILVERKIGAVFVESSVSDRNIRALIEGAAAQGHDVKIGGELFSDAMGTAGSYEGTYMGMIDHNVSVIAGAMGGDVPANGMDGKLDAGM